MKLYKNKTTKKKNKLMICLISGSEFFCWIATYVNNKDHDDSFAKNNKDNNVISRNGNNDSK